MFNHSIKTTIGVIKYHVKELLGLADTALVKKWALKQGLGRLDMRRKSCWRLVLEAVFVAIHKDHRLCAMEQAKQEWAIAA